MARTRSSGNGHLEEALAQLIQNQAAFVAQARETDRLMAESNRAIDERFRRIEATLAELIRLLHGLPDAVRDKIGFKAPPKAPGT